MKFSSCNFEALYLQPLRWLRLRSFVTWLVSFFCSNYWWNSETLCQAAWKILVIAWKAFVFLFGSFRYEVWGMRNEEQLSNWYDEFGSVFDMPTPTYKVKMLLSETLVRARRRLCEQLEVSKEEFCEGVLQVRWCPGCLWTCLMCKNELLSGYWLLYEKGHLYNICNCQTWFFDIFGDSICSPLDSNTGCFYHAIELTVTLKCYNVDCMADMAGGETWQQARLLQMQRGWPIFVRFAAGKCIPYVKDG